MSTRHVFFVLDLSNFSTPQLELAQHPVFISSIHFGVTMGKFIKQTGFIHYPHEVCAWPGWQTSKALKPPPAASSIAWSSHSARSWSWASLWRRVVELAIFPSAFVTGSLWKGSVYHYTYSINICIICIYIYIYTCIFAGVWDLILMVRRWPGFFG